MCGISAIFDFKGELQEERGKLLGMSAKLRHRGPDWSGFYADKHAMLAHERLSIMDVSGGTQPLTSKSGQIILVANGEIYNHKELRRELKQKHHWRSKSDCEVLLHLYEEQGQRFLDDLDGIFAFIIYDKKKREYLIARDHIGIIPLYIGWSKDGTLHVASEMKALDAHCTKILEFPPGSYYESRTKEFVRWYKRDWMHVLPHKKTTTAALRKHLEIAVKRQMMSDVKFGLLLSGGLDSSIISAIAAKHSKEKLHSFSIGLKGSPDLKHASMVADYLGTEHHEITFSLQEGLDAVADVIYHLETFDTTTIRAATPMYLMARKIRSEGIKMVLSGEGSDEVFGGYLYFHMAPDAKEFHEETVRKLMMLSKYDCLRANKSMAAWGIEARVPFLDKDFLDYAMSIDPAQKMCTKSIEKQLLREAFQDYLPKEVAWRQKEQFSDGVGYSWIDVLKDFTEPQISEREMSSAKKLFPDSTPTSKEQMYYRKLFDKFFKSKSAAKTVPVGASIACSTPTAIRWSKEFKGIDDPSGRAVASVHQGTKLPDAELAFTVV